MAEYYRHFKGNIYQLVSIAKDSETQEKVVVYRAMYGDGSLWVRPYDMFFGKVEREGKIRPRFVQISEEEALANIPLECNPRYHFPDIEYKADMPSMLSPEQGFSKGVRAMVSLLNRRQIVHAGFFEGLNNDDDVEEKALQRILSFNPGDNSEDIFHLIQTWGGISGRGVYVFDGGFHWETISTHYNTLVRTCLSIQDTSDESVRILVEVVKSFNQSVHNIGVSFITKHVRFWLYRSLGLDALPIYDSVMASEVMRRNAVSLKDLEDYWKVMIAKARQLNIQLMPLERQIFQYSLGTR